MTNPYMILLFGLLIVAMLWGFDALNKSFREDYKERRAQIGQALQTCRAVSYFYHRFVLSLLQFHLD